MNLFTKRLPLDLGDCTDDSAELAVCLIVDNGMFYVVMALEVDEVEVATTSEKFTEYLKALDRYIEAG